MRFATRIDRLGTETAFAVSAEAKEHEARGNTVYPFHVGDMNLPTPAVIQEATIRALRDGKTGYCPNGGIPQLRDAIAQDVNRTRGTKYTAENVAVQPGGKPVIGKLLQALMDEGDEVLYPNPGFPIYESQIEFLGGRAVPYAYRERDGRFRLDLGEIEAGIGPRTRILILNDLHNPTGAACSTEELEGLAEIACRRDLFVLSDEAYYDIRFEGNSDSIASLPGMSRRSAILYSFSKKFAMTGWRLGAAVGPADLTQVMVRLNVNQESCSNHFIQYGALAGLTEPDSGAAEMVSLLHARCETALKGLRDVPGVTCCRPRGTFYLYPDVTEAMRARNADYERFRRRALEEAGVSFCTRLHFGRPMSGEKRAYIRLACAGLDEPAIRDGIARFREFVERAG
jgi:aspartate/methionine/tyrosine aminotransferase